MSALGALMALLLFLCSPPQRLSLSAKPPQPLYSLHNGGDGLSTANWIVGPSAARRKIEAGMLRREHDLKRAREEHQHLVERAQILEGTAYRGQGAIEELALLKKQKLRAKDAIARLSRLVSGPQTKTPLLHELGEGGFGRVLFGKSASGEKVAVKIGSPADSYSLLRESLALSCLGGRIGFPKVHFFGEQELLGSGRHAVLVQELLGPSVEKLYFFSTLGTRGFSPSTVLLLAAQLLERLELLSQFGIIHGDVQPGNMLLGRGARNGTVHLIDFGQASLSALDDADLSSAFRGALASRAMASDDIITGTLTFSSISSMIGKRLYEKDDLESLAYSLAYLLSNRLPWSGSQGEESDRDAADRVLSSKRDCSPSSVCDAAVDDRCLHVSQAIAALLTHARELKSSEKPNFKEMGRIVAAAIAEEERRLGGSCSFEWIIERITWCTDDGSLRHELY